MKVFSLLSFVIISHTLAGAHAKQPNIVYILVDDVGYKDIGFQGSEIRTPNIDALAKQGIILNNHYVQHSCAPSRAALLTVRYPTKTGIYTNFAETRPMGVPLNFTLLPQLMKNLGYSTHLVGKWHAGFCKKEYLPTHRGFKTFFGIPMKGADKTTHVNCAGSGRNKDCGYALFNQTESASESYKGKHATTLFFKMAIKLVKHHVKHSPSKEFISIVNCTFLLEKNYTIWQSLFMVITPTAAHTRLKAPKRHILANKHITYMRRRVYAGMITHVDHWIGRLRDVLGELNLWQNTILIFASDNGPSGPFSSSKPLRGGKKEYYEGGIRSVSFMTSPLLHRKGVRVDNLMHVTDWLPTLTKLGGAVQNDPDLDGYDMWQALNNASVENPRKKILHGFDVKVRKFGWYNGSKSFVCDTGVKGALRIGNWKLITGINGGNGRRYALYNIAKDESEKNDLSFARPKKLENMCRIMREHYKKAVQPVYEPHDPNARPSNHGNKWIPWLDNE